MMDNILHWECRDYGELGKMGRISRISWDWAVIPVLVLCCTAFLLTQTSGCFELTLFWTPSFLSINCCFHHRPLPTLTLHQPLLTNHLHLRLQLPFPCLLLLPLLLPLLYPYPDIIIEGIGSSNYLLPLIKLRYLLLILPVHILLILLCLRHLDDLILVELLEQVLGLNRGMSFVGIPNLLQNLHQFHLTLRVIGLVLQGLHRVTLLLLCLQLLQDLLCLLDIPLGVIVPDSSSLHHILRVLRVCFEGDLVAAVGASEVESEDFDAQVHLVVADLHSHGEFGSDVVVVGAGVAADGHWQHVTHVDETVSTSASALEEVGVEVHRDVPVLGATFSHSVQLLQGWDYNLKHYYSDLRQDIR